MKKLYEESGSAALAFIAAFAAFTSVSAFYIIGAAKKDLNKTAEELNRVEGFYSAEMAAWENYYADKTGYFAARKAAQPATSAQDLNWESTYSDCVGKNCVERSLVRRYASGNIQYRTLSTATAASSVYCGLMKFAPNSMKARACLAANSGPRIPAKTVGIEFEDSTSNYFDMPLKSYYWDFPDIRACIKGDFEVEPSTNKIFSTASGQQKLSVQVERRPDAGCRHRFFIEIYDPAGVKKYEEARETTAEPAVPIQTTVTVQKDDEIRLSWESLPQAVTGPFSNICTFQGRDNSRRMTTIRVQPNGKAQVVPRPKFTLGSCGNWLGSPLGGAVSNTEAAVCSGVVQLNSPQDIRKYINDAYSPIQILNSGAPTDWALADQKTREKICSITGHSRVDSYTTTNLNNVDDIATIRWGRDGWWFKQEADYDKTILQSIRCGCP